MHIVSNLLLFFCIAALQNMIGSLTTNAAYALINSRSVQMAKACEPLFTFILTVFFVQELCCSWFFHPVVSGDHSYQVRHILREDASFNIWSLVLEMIEIQLSQCIIFILRNWVKYGTVLFRNMLSYAACFAFLLPVVLVKVLINGEVVTVYSVRI